MSKETVLIVEDSEANRLAIAQGIKKLGFEVLTSVDGKAAWDLLSRPETNVDAVLSDIMMPNMDGIELLKLVRGSLKYGVIPFFLITAVAEKEYMIAAKEAGVSGYFMKPISFQRLQDKLNEIFNPKGMVG